MPNRDPSWSLDDERWRKGDFRRPPTAGPARNGPLTAPERSAQGLGRTGPASYLEGEVDRIRRRGVLGATLDSAAATGRHIADSYRSSEQAFDRFLHGERPAPTYDGPIRIEDGSRPRPAGISIIEPRNLSATRSEITGERGRRAGLTRIVRMPDGSFTDQAPDGVGEERFYDATGRRVDTAFGGGLLVDDAGNVGISGPAEWARREQAAALDMNDPANRDRVLAAGREGLRRVEAMQADAARRRALDAELRMTPEMRLERDVEVAKETGLNRRAQLEADTNLAVAGARAASDRAAAQSEAAKDLIEQQREEMRYWDERFAANPDEAVRAMLAQLENVPREQWPTILSDKTHPLSPVLGSLRTAVRQRGMQRFGNNWTPAQTTTPNFIADWLGYGFQSRPGWFGSEAFNADDLFPFMADEDMQALIDADVLARGG